MEKDKKIKKLTDVINAIDNIDSWNDEFNKWRNNTIGALEYVFGIGSNQVNQFKQIQYNPTHFTPEMKEFNDNFFKESFSKAKSFLEEMLKEVEEYH